jgi:hypothetical protein
MASPLRACPEQREGAGARRVIIVIEDRLSVECMNNHNYHNLLS